MKKQLLIFTTLLLAALSYGQTFTDNFISYNVTSATTVEVTDYDDVNGGPTVVIPASVTHNSLNYSVTSIKFLAFQNNAITSVDLPDSLITIGVGAFSGSTLNTVTFGNSVTTIDNSAFYNCSLTDATIPDSVTSIGNSAFQNNSLTNLSIGNNVATIGNWAFTSNSLTAITIPESVTSIGEIAFQGNPLTDIISEAIIPPSITTSTTSGMDTFNTDRSNIDLTIPTGTSAAYVSAQWTGFNSVTEVGSIQVGDTFVFDFITYEITSLTPETVEAIDYDMAGGTVVNIPSTVTNSAINFEVRTIGGSAFNNKNLTSVTIPNSVISTSFQSFANNQLTSIVIPDSVTTMGNSTFQNNQLSNVSLSSNATVLGSLIFANNQLTNITIPNGVTTIADVAFINNALTNITIPSSVTTIASGAFINNPLTSVTSESITPPSIFTGGNNDSFSDDRSGIDLIIPIGTTGPYVTDPGALWTGFNSVTEAVLSVSDYGLANTVKVITTFDEIKIVSNGGYELKSYAIYNITGAKVASGTESEISKSFLSDGVYILKLTFNKGTLSKKVIIN